MLALRVEDPTDRLAITVGDLAVRATPGQLYRALSTVIPSALAGLGRALQLEVGGPLVCEWCTSSDHAITGCPDIPADIVLALYES